MAKAKSKSGKKRGVHGPGDPQPSREQGPSLSRTKRRHADPATPADSRIKWSRMHKKTREWTRRMLRSESLKHDDWVVRLDDYEAAEYLGIGIRSFRRLVERGVLRFYPDTRLFDVDELQDYVLSGAKSAEERRQSVLRRVRWEAYDLEKYPLTLRLDIMGDFAAIWEQLAAKFEAGGFDDEARAVRMIVKQTRDRLKGIATAN